MTATTTTPCGVSIPPILTAWPQHLATAGYAWERVRALKELANRLEPEILTPRGLWVREVKAVGGGKNAREVTVERFNAAEFEHVRGVLADLAKEAGGRKDIQLPSRDAENPPEVRHEHGLDVARLTDEELGETEHLADRVT